MYEPILFIHSWIRWAVLFGAGLLLLKTLNGWFKKKSWTGNDNSLVWAFSQVLGYQLMFGITLYLGLSPMTKASFMSFKVALENPVLRFWSVQHMACMLIAFTVFHIGKHLSFKRTTLENRHRAVALTMLSSISIITIGVPWTFLSYGRPWIRGFW